MAILNNNPLIGSGGNQGYNINNSLRFRSSASAYLSRTPASAGDRQKWTWSGWVKRGALSSYQTLFSAYGGSANVDEQIRLYNSDALNIEYYSTPSFVYQLITTQVFRDPSAWYHVVVAVDTTQATAANRIKVYVNGNQVTAFSTATYPAQNTNTLINGTYAHYISVDANNGLNSYFDGYQTELNFVGGSQLTPSSFGETDTTTGVWKPKAYTSTYGTNGFYLKFSDIATTSGSNAGLGKDFSGNTNYWTTNNISVTSGTTYDAMTDSPTNTSATVANYAVLNSLSKGANATLSNANLNWAAAQMVGGKHQAITSISMSSGKWYCEFTPLGSEANGCIFGIVSDTNTTGDIPGFTSSSYGYAGFNGNKYTNSSGSAYGATFTLGDVIGIAFDADAGTLTYYKNNTSQGTAFSSIPAGSYYFGVGNNSSLNVLQAAFNAGQRPFSYTPPTGYLALNTFNLPNPTILQGNKYMDATLYTGDGASSKTITNAASFQPDLVWAKDRSVANTHVLVDAVRGAGNWLQSNATSAEGGPNQLISALNSNGFSVNISPNATLNANGDAYVAWQWQAGQGSTSSNTSGSITSTVSVNTTAGFSVVTYTGNGGSNVSVGHGLGVAPKLVLTKDRTSTGVWDFTYTFGDGSYDFLELNSTAAKIDITGRSAPTSTLYYVNGTNSNVNTRNYVSYCWAEIAGFSRFGSYTGNGSTDGPFVYTGFRPKFIMYKRTDATQSWIPMDTSRNPYNVADKFLLANASDSEYTGTILDMLSNGFKIREAGTQTNASGGTYIFMAFAENPFKNSLAR